MKPLKRHPALVALSREHHHALALCVRVLRAPSQNHRDDIEALFPQLLHHFAEEEDQFAPYWAFIDAAMKRRFDDEHAKLRAMIAAPRFDDESWNRTFAETLRDHARFEERELFPAAEPLLPAADAV